MRDLTSPRPLRVELHGFQEAAVDVTPWVTDVTWTTRTHAPFDTIELSLQVPIGAWRHVFPGVVAWGGSTTKNKAPGSLRRRPTPCAWVVVRLPDDRGDWPAVAWGHVNRLNTGISVTDGPNGTVKSKRARLEVESWYTFIGKSRILLAPGAHVAVPGFIYDLAVWAPRMKELLEGLLSRPPAALFREFLAEMAQILVPTSLCPGETPLGNEVRFVGSREDAARYAPLRARATTAIPGELLSAAGGMLPRGTLGQWLAQTFVTEGALIECFPTLEVPDHTAALHKGSGAFDSALGDDILRATTAVDLEAEDSGGAPVQLPPFPTPTKTALGFALGSQPALVYRLRPTYLLPLDRGTLTEQWRALNRRRGNDSPLDFLTRNRAELVVLQSGLKTAYGLNPGSTQTGYAVPWQRFARGDLHDWNVAWDDDDRVNAVAVKTAFNPEGEVSTWGLLAEPVVNLPDVWRNGLRVYDVDWPFQPPGGWEGGPSLADRLAAFSELAWHMVGNVDDIYYGAGSLSGAYRPRLTAGHWIAGQLPADLEHSPDLASAGFCAYAEEVTHRVAVVNGHAVSGRTDVSFSRCTIDGETLAPEVPAPFRYYAEDFE